MATSTTVLIVFFVVAAILIVGILAALAWVLLNERTQHRHVEADKIGDGAMRETLQVRQQEAIAHEIAAAALAGQAEADVEAARASAQSPVGTVRTAVDLSLA